MNKEEPTKPKEVVVSPKGSKVDLTKEDEEMVKKDVEEKTRVEDKPVKPKKEERKIEVTKEEFMSFAALSDKLVRMERMLEWLIVQRVTDDQKLIKQPNISDIFRNIMNKMVDEKKEKDEVPTDT